MTLAQAAVVFAFQDISQYFVNGFDDILNNSLTLGAVYRDGLMGYHGVPQMPMFAYKAVGDLVSPINDTDKLVQKYCQVGANILYLRNSIGGHSAEATNGNAAASAWLGAVLDGSFSTKYAAQGCTTSNVSVNITSSPFK